MIFPGKKLWNVSEWTRTQDQTDIRKFNKKVDRIDQTLIAIGTLYKTEEEAAQLRRGIFQRRARMQEEDEQLCYISMSL